MYSPSTREIIELHSISRSRCCTKETDEQRKIRQGLQYSKKSFFFACRNSSIRMVGWCGTKCRTKERTTIISLILLGFVLLFFSNVFVERLIAIPRMRKSLPYFVHKLFSHPPAVSFLFYLINRTLLSCAALSGSFHQLEGSFVFILFPNFT